MVQTVESQLDEFLDKFNPDVASVAHACIQKMRKRYPSAAQLVYDNYNALAIGFGPTEKTSLAIFSIAVFPRWVSFFFLQGAALKDPRKILKGMGNKARHIVLKGAADLDSEPVVEMMRAAIELAQQPFEPSGKGPLIIKSVSAKQRPRRPKEVTS